MIFAEGFVGGLEHHVDAMPFVFGVVNVELFGAERAFDGDLVRWWQNIGASEGDHSRAKVACSLFVRYRKLENRIGSGERVHARVVSCSWVMG